LTIGYEAAVALTEADIDLAGTAHATEHASIGVPLGHRWVSAARHPAAGKLTVFVYDGYGDGAGFAERGYDATRTAIASWHREVGCLSRTYLWRSLGTSSGV
jgi:DEAD/DEAH box helicase domain-containing protein